MLDKDQQERNKAMRTRFYFSRNVTLSMKIIALALMLLFQNPATAGDHARGKKPSQLQISRDDSSGTVTVSWNGQGVLKQSSTPDGKFKPVRSQDGRHTTTAESTRMIYSLESAAGNLYSINAVGYVNVPL